MGIGQPILFGGRKEDRAERAEREGSRGRGQREERERKRQCVRAAVAQKIKSGNYLEQHDSPNTWTVSATVVLLWPGSILLSGQLYFIPSR